MTTTTVTMTTTPTTATGDTSYRDQFNSTKDLAVLLLAPIQAAGKVIGAVRHPLLYSHRGVPTVLSAFVNRTTGRWRPSAPEGSEAKTAEAEAEAAGEWEACKALLLDPLVLPPGSVRASENGVQLQPWEVFLNEWGDCAGEGGERLAGRIRAAATPALRAGLATHTLTLSYKNYTMPELLSAILKESGGAASLSGFEQVGHIAHVNLSKQHLPFRHIIGQVILDCNPTVAVVVNKTDSISSVFREFKMDVIAQRLAGGDTGIAEHKDAGLWATPHTAMTQEELDELLTATVRQHGLRFRVPYSRVYWNSRLDQEHTRLVEALRPGDALFDVMAGIGPFAIPAAKAGACVLANDLNPVAAEYMVINARLNKIDLAAHSFFAFNLDGRVFLQETLYDHVVGLAPADVRVRCTGRRHVIMNLPAIAVEFLDVFNPASVGSRWQQRLPDGCGGEVAVDRLVLFHVYCFSAAGDGVLSDAVAQVEHHLGYRLEERNKEEVFLVRDVAPTKRMVCVSFTLPDAFWAQLFSRDGEPRSKVARMEGDGESVIH